MGRALRPHMPGVAFHLTARLHGGDRLLTGIEGVVVGMILAEAGRAGVRVLAYAVLSNHLHVVAVQGNRGLSSYMQPLMRRVALLVRAVHGIEGHVFGRRYAHRACLDADYFRTAIAYVNLNPVRAGICLDADDYPWSSQRLYSAAARARAASGYPAPMLLCAANALRVFAGRPDADLPECGADYRRFLEWRLARDRFNALAPGQVDDQPPISPDCFGGDIYWAAGLGVSACAVASLARTPRAPAAELKSVATVALHAVAPHMPLALVRERGSAWPVCAARRAVIAACLDAGFATRQVATFLRVSDSTVSRVASALRNAVVQRSDSLYAAQDLPAGIDFAGRRGYGAARGGSPPAEAE